MPSSNTIGSKPDGRRARSEKTRAAIVDALMELIEEGNLAPTSEDVAVRASVGHRTVFRHFEDMDTLYREIDARLRAQIVESTPPIPPTGSLAERIEKLVRVRSRVFEKAMMFKLATDTRKWESSFLQEAHQRDVKFLRDRLYATVPEINDRPKAIQSIVELLYSFDTWLQLRRDQGHSPIKAREALVKAISELLR